MLTKTDNQVPYSQTLTKNFSYGPRILLHRVLASLSTFIPASKWKQSAVLENAYRRNFAAMQSGGLTPDAIEAFMLANDKRVDGTTPRKLRDHGIDDERLTNANSWGMVQMGALLLRNVIERNRDHIDSVCNLGARIDPISSYMAGQFPDISFTSIDMQNTLEEANASLPQYKNWTFLPGYALSIYRDSDYRSDIVYMTSTSPKFNAREMREYLDAFKFKDAKILIFNEPWWVFPFGIESFRQTLPEHIPPDSARLGGWLADYHHNYPVLLDRAGFDVVLLRMLPGTVSSGGWYNHLQVVGVNRAFKKLITFRPDEV